MSAVGSGVAAAAWRGGVVKACAVTTMTAILGLWATAGLTARLW